MSDVHIAETPFGRVVTLEGARGRATVHEHGAHVTSWIPADGDEALFLSRKARMDGRVAIRGGVPVIFPQFGPGPYPKHGFARTSRWKLAEYGIDGEAPWARMELVDNMSTRLVWPNDFRLSLIVRVDAAPSALDMALRVDNTGDTAFDFTGALHTYLRVRDVERVAVHGLARRRVRDQLTRTEFTEGDAPVRIAGAVDRVYVDTPGPLLVRDDASVTNARTVRMTTRALPDVVLWNPWVEGARAFDDMDDDEWREMLCLEAAVVATPVTLAPGARWLGAQRLEIVHESRST